MKHLKQNYFYFSPDDPSGNTTPPDPQPQQPPTTPNPQETITQLQSRITQLEQANAELRTAYDKSKNPQPPTPFNRKDIISLFGKEFE